MKNNVNKRVFYPNSLTNTPSRNNTKNADNINKVNSLNSNKLYINKFSFPIFNNNSTARNNSKT